MALLKLRGLSSKLYAAFFLAAVLPVAVAGVASLFYSLDVLKRETLQHLEQEVRNKATGMGRFLGQLRSELLYLSASTTLLDLVDAAAGRGAASRLDDIRARLERDYVAFAETYPYIYQLRYLDARGREIVRIERAGDHARVVQARQLQDKSDRYYVQEGLQYEPGEVYVSPMDLNVERGRIERPERPVARFVTPVADRFGGKAGLLVINLHADFFLGEVQQLASARGGVTYLFNRSGFYLSRAAGEAGATRPFEMKSMEEITGTVPRPLLSRILSGAAGTEIVDDWIVAFAPVEAAAPRGFESLGYRKLPQTEWTVALAYPRSQLFAAVFNLYVLYGFLGMSLAVAMVAGWRMSRHLLRPLSELRRETEAIAHGNFSQRVEIHGGDEIADLGHSFNRMAQDLERSYHALAERKERLEEEVAARTAALERAQEERRELDRQAFQMEKMATMGELAIGVAHEIGNPLAGIKTVVQALLEDEAAAETMRAKLGRIQKEIDRLTNFLRSFQGFAVPQAFHPVACRLRDVVEDVLFWTRKEAKSRGVEISYQQCHPELPDLWADPNQLKQVLLNLVINAVHAMPDGGRIAIRMCEGDPQWHGLRGPTGKVRLCVVDDGPGIPADALARIFEPFFTTRPNGSGLGLAVVKKIVDQHGAEMRVDSRVGAGTRFELAWPVAPSACRQTARPVRIAGARR